MNIYILILKNEFIMFRKLSWEIHAFILTYSLCLAILDSPVQGTYQSWTKPPFPNEFRNVYQILPVTLTQ